MPADDVVVDDDGNPTYEGRPVTRHWGKMGKSLKNSVSPEQIYDAYGADTLRLHLMATGPLDASRPWETRDVVGMFRFLQRLWRNIVDEQTGESRVVDTPADDETTKLLHRTIDSVRADMEALRFNTAIAKLIELNNHVTKLAATPREVAEALVLMASPLVPHVGEELWHRLGHDGTIAYEPMPIADPALLVEDTVEYPVQVNGKLRSHVTVAADADVAAVEAAALADAKVQAAIGGADATPCRRRPRPDGQRRRLTVDPDAVGVFRAGRVGTWHSDGSKHSDLRRRAVPSRSRARLFMQ